MNLAVQSMNPMTAFGMECAAVTVKNRKDTQTRMQSIGDSNTAKKKALNYNCREIASQLMRATKARSAGVVLTKAKNKLTMLQRCKGSGQYNSSEVNAAIAHAKRMVKCAKLKVGNLKQEEDLAKTRERKLTSMRQQQKAETKAASVQEENQTLQKEAAEELNQMMSEKTFCRELSRKRRMHRNEERDKILEAEMKYLQEQNCQSGSDTSSAGVSFAGSSAAGATVDICL